MRRPAVTHDIKYPEEISFPNAGEIGFVSDSEEAL